MLAEFLSYGAACTVSGWLPAAPRPRAAGPALDGVRSGRAAQRHAARAGEVESAQRSTGVGRDEEDAGGRKPDSETMVDRQRQMGRQREAGGGWMEADPGGGRPGSL